MIVKQYFEGGLNMINLTAFTQAKNHMAKTYSSKGQQMAIIDKKFVNIENVFCCGSEYTILA